ncbi:rhodanese-like domain-containing protein [Rhizobiaceae bacterium]|nr:rhodanese-like domain-containing protein [Rhizobiaceae bacterium]
MTKSAADYLAEANAAVPRIPGAEAIAQHGSNAIFIDVRDSGDIAKSGTVAGALRIPRGMIEFRADPAMEKFHEPKLKKDAKLMLVCGAGGQAALSGKTLMDMGYTDVTNIGGIGEWSEANGPMEDVPGEDEEE